MNRTFVNLQGGLGNQLFIYFYSLYFSERYQKRITYLSNGKNVLFKVGIEIQKDTFSMNKIIGNAFFALIGKLSSYAFFNRYIYTPKEIGFEKPQKNLNQTIFVGGYFQTPDYMNKLSLSRQIINEINVFLDQRQSIKPEIDFRNSAAVHIRRGDYLLPKNSYFGILSSDYYIDAISRLLRSNDVDNIYLFSDSKLSPSFLVRLKDYFSQISFVEMFDKSLSDIDTLGLLTRFEAIVISNSTFAWWGAFLNGNSKVFCPNKWFKERPDPNMIYPKHWITITSRWGQF